MSLPAKLPSLKDKNALGAASLATGEKVNAMVPVRSAKPAAKRRTRRKLAVKTETE